MTTASFLARLAIAGVTVIALLVLQAFLDEPHRQPDTCTAQRCA